MWVVANGQEKRLKSRKKFSAEKPVVAIGPRGSGRISTLTGNDVDLIVGRNADSLGDEACVTDENRRELL